MANKDYIERLAQVIFHLHKASGVWVESVPVHEVFQGQTLWNGIVEVFTVNHPKAKHAYAWSYTGDNGGEEFVAVLELPPVTSPETAVKVAVGHAVKKARSMKGEK